MKKYVKVFEDFNAHKDWQKQYRLIAAISCDPCDKFIVNNKNWIWLNLEIELYTNNRTRDTLASTFISPENLSFSDAKILLEETRELYAKELINLIDAAMIFMPSTMKGDVQFVRTGDCSFRTVSRQEEDNIIDYMHFTSFTTKSDTAIEMFMRVFPEEMHSLRGQLSAKKFGF